jgi:UDP-N-acetyl-D-galactosamine dehydrogenase
VAQIVKAMLRKRIHVAGARVLVLGLTFKENCPDIRNTRVVDIVRELRQYGARVDVHDPWADAAEARHEYGIELTPSPRSGAYDAVVLAVAHRQFREMGARGIRALGRRKSVVYDIKYVLPASASDARL